MNEDKSARYHRLHRRAAVAGTGLTALLLILLLTSGGSVALRDLAADLVGGSFFSTIIVYVHLLGLANETVQLPLAYYRGITLERRYGLSTQSTSGWWLDHAKALGIGLFLASMAAVVICLLLRVSPGHWWVAAAVFFSIVLVGLAQIAPVVLMPVFYEFRPLERAELAERLISLAERAGTRVLGVFEWRLSHRTRKANAALVGIGRTRRILVSDTLLAEHSDDEIEVILAHELAHHLHRDIWSAIGVETVLIALGFYLTDVVLSFYAMSFGLAGKSDIAALPLVLLTVGAVSTMLMPLVNALSRAHERRADRFALDVTRNAAAFITAMRRLGTQNLAEEYPSRLVELLFHTHPSIRARIAAAQKWGQPT
jgi:STE24 endopeptidase